MGQRRKPARDVAKDHGKGRFWIDHAKIVEDDFQWLQQARCLTLWNVQVPAGFLGRLPELWWLDVRGGTMERFELANGCTGLRYLAINQVRKLANIDDIIANDSLEMLSLYGLRTVLQLPSLAALKELRRLELGQLKGVKAIGPTLDAPRLQELQILKTVTITSKDVTRIQEHESLNAFAWWHDDVPRRMFEPVIEAIRLPKTKRMYPEDWFEQRKA